MALAPFLNKNMKHLIYIFLAFNFIGLNAQENNAQLACDTVRNVTILVENVNGIVCCFDVEAYKTIKIDCENYVLGECEKPTPFATNCIEKRTYKLGYDNGLTSGSVTNDCGERVNLIRFNQSFTVVSWEVNGQLVGQGETIGSYAGWTQQLQGWSTFFNQFDPNIADANFGFNPAPTWRYSEIIGCSPQAEYGNLILERIDGCIFTVYPILTSEETQRVNSYSVCDRDGVKETKYCDLDDTPIEIPEDLECFVPCGYDFGDFIATDAISPCSSETRILCDNVEGVNIEFIRIVTVCDGVDVSWINYTLDSYNNAVDPDGLIEYVIQGNVVNCVTGEIVPDPTVCGEPLTAISKCYMDSLGNKLNIKDVCYTNGCTISYLNEVEINTDTLFVCPDILEAVCDTCIIGQKTIIDEPVTFLPVGVSETAHSYDWIASGAIDTAHPLVNCGLSWTPTTTIAGANVHFDFSSIPDCAIINSVQVSHIGNGGSGNVWGVFDSSTGNQFTQTINGGTITNNVWHVGNRSTCTVSSNYTQTEFIGFPCGTTRPTDALQESISTVNGISTGADLQDLVIRLMAINNTDIVTCTNFIVDYSLPDGCSELDENGNPIGYVEKKVLNVAFDAACSDTLVVSIAEKDQIDVTEQFILNCDDTDGDDIGDVLYYTQIVTTFTNGAQSNQTTTNLEDDFLTIYTPINPVDECEAGILPPTDRERLCDSGNNDYPYFQNTFVVNQTSVLVTNTELDGMTNYTVLGQPISCPDVISTQKACVLFEGESYKGTTYIFANGDGYFEGYNGLIIDKGDYQEYCCNDCIQASECFGGRGASASSATLEDGTVVLVQDLIVDGIPNSVNDLAQTLVNLYGGTYSTLDEDLTYCGNTDLKNYEFIGLSVEIDFITNLFGGSEFIIDVVRFGNCDFSNNVADVNWDYCIDNEKVKIVTFENNNTIIYNLDGTVNTGVLGCCDCVAACTIKETTTAQVRSLGVDSSPNSIKIELTAAQITFVQNCTGSMELVTNLGTAIIDQSDTVLVSGNTLSVTKTGVNTCNLNHEIFDGLYNSITINCYE